MKRPRLSIRLRLTLLYTSLFAVGGAIVVTVTYLLVAALPVGDSTLYSINNPAELVDKCLAAQKEPPETSPELRAKCSSVFQADDPVAFLGKCNAALKEPPGSNDDLLTKCELTFQEGVVAGAKGQRGATLQSLLQYAIGTLVLVTALAAVAGWIVAGRVLRPVHQITAAARDASLSDLSARVALSGPRDELRELADTFDGMLDRLQATFEGQRRFIANASHELRTPLTVMRTAVDVVLTKPAPSQAELVGMGQEVRRAVSDAERLIEALLTLARNDHGLTVRDEVDLATVVEDVLDSSPGADCELSALLQPAITVGDSVLLERLVANLVDNASRHNVPGGRVWVATSTVNQQVVLEVANTGPVISIEAVETLFAPFRRLHDRTTSDGFGLGLTIVASIAAMHGGTVTALPRPGGGLTVTVTAPSGGHPIRTSPL